MLNGLTLAYIGDAVYELAIRKHLISQGLTKVNDLHNQAIKYTQASAQALAALKLVDSYYTKDEINTFKRGRNQSATHKPKNTDVSTYNKSTGFEAVLGHLYLDNKQDRLNNIISKTIQFIDELVDNN